MLGQMYKTSFYYIVKEKKNKQGWWVNKIKKERESGLLK